MPSETPNAVYELIPMAHVVDVEKSIQFYELLGFHARDRVQHAGRTQWASLAAGRARLMLAAADGPIDPHQQAILFYLYTQDLKALRSRLLASGLVDGGRYCGAPEPRHSVAYEIAHPFYMPEGEMRVSDPDRYCLLIGQCELKD